MSKILTPLSLWNNFDCSKETQPETISVYHEDGVTVERVKFFGRETENGRVRVAAAFAYSSLALSQETVLIFSDSDKTIDDSLLKLFVSRGYSALAVDYRGEWDGCDFYTEYPDDVSYANVKTCERYKDYVDDSADRTSWYEWVAIGIYAKKYIKERTGSENIAVLGIRDGGEIAWKLGVAEKFSCIIPICAAGWKAYAGISKYLPTEPNLDEERYRFIAGIDSQAYAPYVQCPVLMLCPTSVEDFDCDRAYDTFSRINAEYISDSVFLYSLLNNGTIDVNGTADTFMFLDKNLKQRLVFIPKPPTVEVEMDEESNLIATVIIDDQGEAENCETYLSEDGFDTNFREWLSCPQKESVSEKESKYLLNIYEKTSNIFVVCNVKYSNGFTVWSKMNVKKVGGTFRNVRPKSNVIFSLDTGEDAFSVADPQNYAVGGVFFTDANLKPVFVTKEKEIKGVYAECGLSTLRMTNDGFAPAAGNVLSIDLFCDQTAEFTFTVYDLITKEEFVATQQVLGKVWQRFILDCTAFKDATGAVLSAFSRNMKFTINCTEMYAVNNVMWL